MNRNGLFSSSPVVITLILVCAGLFGADFLFERLTTFRIDARAPISALLSLEPIVDWTLLYRPLTYGFLHANPMHLAMNMLVLFFLGRSFESMWGGRRFARFFVSAVMASGLFTLLVYLLIPHNRTIVVGASGALCALFFAFWRLNPEGRVLLFFIIPMPIRYAMVGMIAFDVLGTVSPLFDTGLAHPTHLGGYLFGWFSLSYADRMMLFFEQRKADWHRWQMARQQAKRADKERLYSEEIDPILKKISEQGMEALNDIEKAILKRAGKLK